MKSEDSKLDEELMYHRVGKCSPLSRDCFCSCFFSLFTCEHEFLNPILGKSFIPYRTDRSASEDGSVSVDPSLLTGLRKESPKGESFGTSGIFYQWAKTGEPSISSSLIKERKQDEQARVSIGDFKVGASLLLYYSNGRSRDWCPKWREIYKKLAFCPDRTFSIHDLLYEGKSESLIWQLYKIDTF